MKKSRTWISFITLVFLLSLPVHTWAWSGEVVGITEGDTITVLNSKTLKDVKIRLYGIDCPEGGQAFSKRAKQFTSKMVFGKVVEVGAITVDHYGRTVSLVYVEGKGVCDELIRAGLAWVYYLYCNLPICAEWKNLEAEAKEAKRGLWSEHNPIPPWEFRRQKRKGGK
ncbi:MAG: thermonuclease family protein [Syntrophobacteria bacterium]|jgi:endonuclease YncB( thermonuclease family)|nr:thermonuclease family protein [Deltaproteobacteria bacterium]MDH3930305.1 thermonuclease family protein [Deltaproteobacteria bacterium]MDH3951527.1 thermonuclease family protein [Deltaproteobacteria bacterium]